MSSEHSCVAEEMRKESKLLRVNNGFEILKLKTKTLYESPTDGFFKHEVGKKPERVLMVVGATGAGKSTLINGIANYVYGVEWDDKFRFILIPEATKQNQSESQTREVTAYTLHSNILPYTLTIVDTPGFGDTGGIERDKEIAKTIKRFFSEKSKGGVDHLNGIGFVVQACQPRLTPTQKYIFEAVLAIFGNDIVDNIFLMCTFADGGTPEVLATTKAAKIPYKESFKFNNSVLFASNSGDPEFNKMFWKMGCSSFQDFFSHFSQAAPCSLKLTREVLEESEQRENLISCLQQQVRVRLDQLHQIQKEEDIIKQHEAEIEANKDFDYEVEVTKFKKISLEGTGLHTTTCRVCNFTCHKSCPCSNDELKDKCVAIGRDGKCTVCPGKCHWTEHTNLPFVYEYYTEKESRTYSNLKEKYDTAKTGKERVEAMIKDNKAALDQTQQEVYSTVDKIKKSNERLAEIALRPNPLANIDLLNFLIKTEEMEGKPGWEDRVMQYKVIRDREELVKNAVAETASVVQPHTTSQVPVPFHGCPSPPQGTFWQRLQRGAQVIKAHHSRLSGNVCREVTKKPWPQ